MKGLKGITVFFIAAMIVLLLILMLNHDWLPFAAGEDVLVISREEVGILSRNQFIGIFYYMMFVIVSVLFIGYVWRGEHAVPWILLMAHALLGMAGCLGGMDLSGERNDFLGIIANSYYALSVVPLFLYAALMLKSCRKIFLPLVLMYCMCSSAYLLLEAASVDAVAVAVGRQMSTWIFFLVLLALILLMHVECRKENPDAYLFLKILYIAVAGFMICACISWLAGGIEKTDSAFLKFWKFIRDGDMDSLRIFYIQWFFTAICITYVSLQYSIQWYREWMGYQMLHVRMESAVEFAEKANQYMEEVRAVKHDMNRHLSVIHMYLSDQRYEDAAKYLERLKIQSDEAYAEIYCRNLLINFIVGKYAKQAQEKGILFVWDIHVPDQLGIADEDLCSLLDNILENAIEACMKMQCKDADIRLKIGIENGVLRIRCSNSYKGELKEQYGGYKTTKKDKSIHGYGLHIIRKICENYGGGLHVQAEDGRFSLKAAVPEKN